MSRLAASKLRSGLTGRHYVSRSTLSGLAHRIPTNTTLANLDTLLSWEPGSARRALLGQQPAAREEQSPNRPRYDMYAVDDYPNLTRWIGARLRELNLSKVRFAEVSSIGRSTLATLGTRGYTPTHKTLNKIDTYLMWEPGSALAAIKGGEPVRRGPIRSPHSSLIQITAIKDRLQTVDAKLTRHADAIDATRKDIAAIQRHVDLLHRDSQDDPAIPLSNTEVDEGWSNL